MPVAGDTTLHLHILLVQRSSPRAAAVHDLLARFGGARFIVEEADSLSTALLRLNKKDIRVILLDSTLPSTEKLGCLETFLSRFPGTPVIMLANFDQRQLAQAALALGAKDWIVSDKIDSNLLGQIILRHVQKV